MKWKGLNSTFVICFFFSCLIYIARRGGAEVAGLTLDRKIRVLFPAYLTTCGPSDGKEVKDLFGRPGARVEVGSAR